MKGHLVLGLLLLELAHIRLAGSAAVPTVPFLSEERPIDGPKVELKCIAPSVLFKTKGGVEICVEPSETWMQKALDALKKRFQQG
ncbi:C-C motif chemokine 4-like [Amblyraja radiata]|uniref:C-C motif chemokine 4-like n=1 Tax=Amblyraja radiata TaxID=386614 RepID=UPI001401C9CC|nr:C-C motif chemokine 4-like [Amblyraja radiata]